MTLGRFIDLGPQQVTTKSFISGMSRPIHVQQFAAKALQGWYGAGYWKDFEGRRLLCEQLGIPFLRTWFDPDDIASAVGMVSPATTDVIVEYSVYPELLQALRHCHPQLKLHVRAHNAEALQHLHRTPPSFLPTRKNAKIVYGALNLARRDRQSASLADTVLGISEYDNRHYWRRLVAAKKLYTVPYFSPWPELRPQVRSGSSLRENRILCMPGGYDRLSQQQRNIFFELAEVVQNVGGESAPDFMITDYSVERFPSPSHIKVLGQIEEPWDLMCHSKGLAVLTDLGFGAKTTIPDAVTAGCLVLVHAGLVPRIPSELQSRIVAVDPSKLDVAARLILGHSSSDSLDCTGPNNVLRSVALTSFREALAAA
jgi:hypothetical protein